MNTQGVLVPIVTPFTKDDSVDVAALEKLIEHFIKVGVAGIVACGTTGEYYALNEEERQQVLECVIRVAKGRVTVIAGDLLQRIETFDGIALLTSNGRGRFDNAFTRRLDAVIEFADRVVPAVEVRRAAREARPLSHRDTDCRASPMSSPSQTERTRSCASPRKPSP